MIATFDLTDEDEDTAVTSAPAFDALPWDVAKPAEHVLVGVLSPAPSAACLARIASRPGVPYIDWERARTIAVEPWENAGDLEP